MPSSPEAINVSNVGTDFACVDWLPSKSNGGAKINCYHVYMSSVLPPEWKYLAQV